MTEPISPDTKPLSLGFIGVGWIGRSRMKALLENGHNAAVIHEPNASNAEEALELAPSSSLADHPENIYGNPDIDGVVIATPSAMHAEQALEALRAGKSVFCQKPLGRTASEVREIIAASEKANKLL